MELIFEKGDIGDAYDSAFCWKPEKAEETLDDNEIVFGAFFPWNEVVILVCEVL